MHPSNRVRHLVFVMLASCYRPRMRKNPHPVNVKRNLSSQNIHKTNSKNS